MNKTYLEEEEEGLECEPPETLKAIRGARRVGRKRTQANAAPRRAKPRHATPGGARYPQNAK